MTQSCVFITHNRPHLSTLNSSIGQTGMEVPSMLHQTMSGHQPKRGPSSAAALLASSTLVTWPTVLVRYPKMISNLSCYCGLHLILMHSFSSSPDVDGDGELGERHPSMYGCRIDHMYGLLCPVFIDCRCCSETLLAH